MNQIQPESVYTISQDIVAREIDGQIVIVPIVAGVGSMDDDLYTLNDTGREAWKLINGKNSVADMAQILAEQYDASSEVIMQDIAQLLEELTAKGIIIAQ